MSYHSKKQSKNLLSKYDGRDHGPDNLIDKYLCDDGHELKLVYTSSYEVFCNKCRGEISSAQIASGFYICPIHEKDYHKGCAANNYHEKDHDPDHDLPILENNSDSIVSHAINFEIDVFQIEFAFN